MAKTKPSAKSQPKKPLATPAKQFTTKPVTSFRRNQPRQSFRRNQRRRFPRLCNKPKNRLVPDVKSVMIHHNSKTTHPFARLPMLSRSQWISMVSPCSSAMTASSHARLFFRRCQETQPELRSWRRWHHIQQFQSAAWSMNVTL